MQIICYLNQINVVNLYMSLFLFTFVAAKRLDAILWGIVVKARED